VAEPINLELLPRRVIDTVDRRVLGAFQFVDAVTGLPVVVPARIEVRGAAIGGAPVDEARHEHAIRILQNRRGIAVIFRAPFFDAYTNAFENPVAPAETAANPLRLRLAVVDAGPYYLPQEFLLDLPRALDADAPNNVFEPQPVRLFRAPNAPVQDGWALLRLLATEAGTDPERPLPGVLVRVFRSPRGLNDVPIGEGMTDWRGDITGEALVPILGIQRFRPGDGENVIETDEAIVFEATRHSGFSGAAGQLPDVPALLAGTGAGLIRPPGTPPGSVLAILNPEPTNPPTPLRVQAGREYTVHLAMP
jgi:hypothetical protein